MNAKQKTHQPYLAEWAARFSAQKASGLTINQWCDQNHPSIPYYNYWKHQLKEEVVDQILPNTVPLFVPTSFSLGPSIPTDILPDEVNISPIVRITRIAQIAQTVLKRTSSFVLMVCLLNMSHP